MSTGRIVAGAVLLAALLFLSAFSTRAAEYLNSGILPNGSSCGLVNMLAGASAKANGMNTMPSATSEATAEQGRAFEDQVRSSYADFVARGADVATPERLIVPWPEITLPVPAVADHWEISPDGLTYTFHVRPTARWSNGDAVTARDFAYSFQRILSPALAAEYAYML